MNTIIRTGLLSTALLFMSLNVNAASDISISYEFIPVDDTAEIQTQTISVSVTNTTLNSVDAVNLTLNSGMAQLAENNMIAVGALAARETKVFTLNIMQMADLDMPAVSMNWQTEFLSIDGLQHSEIVVAHNTAQ